MRHGNNCGGISRHLILMRTCEVAPRGKKAWRDLLRCNANPQATSHKHGAVQCVRSNNYSKSGQSRGGAQHVRSIKEFKNFVEVNILIYRLIFNDFGFGLNLTLT